MGETLDGLYRRLNDLANSINNAWNERQRYMDKAAEVQKVYDRLKKDKDTIVEYKKSVKTFSQETYDDFQGNVFESVYQLEAKSVVTTYDRVISRIDTNLDALNEEVLRYKQKAADSLGPIGSLESAYYYVSTKIQNWRN